MRKLAHVGKNKLRVTFEIYVCDVRGLPSHVRQISIVWGRSSRADEAQSSTVGTSDMGSSEAAAMVNEKLHMTATLYRSARRATFDAKPSTVTVLDASRAVANPAFDVTPAALLSAIVTERGPIDCAAGQTPARANI